MQEPANKLVDTFFDLCTMQLARLCRKFFGKQIRLARLAWFGLCKTGYNLHTITGAAIAQGEIRLAKRSQEGSSVLLEILPDTADFLTQPGALKDGCHYIQRLFTRPDAEVSTPIHLTHSEICQHGTACWVMRHWDLPETAPVTPMF